MTTIDHTSPAWIAPSEVAFTAAVKARQTRHGSRAGYASFEARRGWEAKVTPVLAEFIAAQTSFYIATANAEGQPYIQHRGGAPGFLHILDEQTLAFADYAGNQQYITAGNLDENPKAQLFLMDYARAQRIKIWGEAFVIDDDAASRHTLSERAALARGERVIVFKIKAWDANCPKYIPKLLPIDEVMPEIEARDRKIAALEARLQALEAQGAQ